MRIDQLPRSDNVEDRRSEGGLGRSGGIRIPGGRGGLGIGTIIVLVLVGWWLGIDPSILIGGADILTGGGTTQQHTRDAPGSNQADTQAPSDQTKEMVSAVLGSTEAVWSKVFQQAGEQYEPPTLVMFSGFTRSGCGFAQSAMGPLYCPEDRKVYLDTSFFRDLERRFNACDAGSKACQSSQAYVITHEVGHHVQNLLGILPKAQQMQQSVDKVEANHIQVRVELQADCLAGVWANRSEQEWKFIDPGDVEAAMQTASAIGDDRLQRQTQGYVVPDAFTHGSSQQRTRWFMTGLKSGKVDSCDTFSTPRM
jgi:predicted metalloprotease